MVKDSASGLGSATATATAAEMETSNPVAAAHFGCKARRNCLAARNGCFFGELMDAGWVERMHGCWRGLVYFVSLLASDIEAGCLG